MTTTPNPELPESVVTDEMVERAAEAIMSFNYYAKRGTPDGDIHWKGKSELYLKQARAALQAVIPYLRAANARAEGLVEAATHVLYSRGDDTIVGHDANGHPLNQAGVDRWRLREVLAQFDAAQAVRSEASEGEGS